MPAVRYTVVNGEVIAEKRNGVRRLYVPDPLGSTVALVDNTQTITDRFSYWPYGEEASRTGTTPTPFRYGGTLGYYRDSSARTSARTYTYRQDIGRPLRQEWGRLTTAAGVSLWDPAMPDGGDTDGEEAGRGATSGLPLLVVLLCAPERPKGPARPPRRRAQRPDPVTECLAKCKGRARSCGSACSESEATCQKRARTKAEGKACYFEGLACTNECKAHGRDCAIRCLRDYRGRFSWPWPPFKWQYPPFD